MARGIPALREASRAILHEIRVRARRTPFLVALDGGSGCGKSSIAQLMQPELDAALVPSDDFFAAAIPSVGWDSRSASEKARDCIDWRQLRSEALEPLLAGERALWHPFDFAGGTRPDGTYGMKSTCVEIEPAPVILLDGNFSTGPQLVDLINLTVLVDVVDIERGARLERRQGPIFLQLWHARWDAVEEYYYTSVRPRGSFDLVVTT